MAMHSLCRHTSVQPSNKTMAHNSKHVYAHTRISRGHMALPWKGPVQQARVWYTISLGQYVTWTILPNNTGNAHGGGHLQADMALSTLYWEGPAEHLLVRSI